MYVTIQADYLGRYELNEGQGIWNTSGDRIFLSTGELNRFSCVWGEPCTWSAEKPQEYQLVHNILSDILMIDGREDVRFIRHPDSYWLNPALLVFHVIGNEFGRIT